jgi:hypothetical protein
LEAYEVASYIEKPISFAKNTFIGLVATTVSSCYRRRLKGDVVIVLSLPDSIGWTLVPKNLFPVKRNSYIGQCFYIDVGMQTYVSAASRLSLRLKYAGSNSVLA